MADPQQITGGELADKARDAARDHPEQARGAIDRVEDLINERTGGRFDSIIEAGGDLVERQLGLPEEVPAPSPAPGPEDPQPRDPDGPVTPGESPGGSPQETPELPTPPEPTPSPEPAPSPQPGPSTAPDADPQTRPADPPPGGEGQLPG